MRLDTLKDVFKPLADASHREKTVEVMGVSVTLRTLTPKEEIEVQKHLPDLNNAEEEVTPLEFVDAFRIETLARSIIQIGDKDLRGLLYLETEETTDSGLSVKVTKVEGVRELLLGWSRLILTKLFDGFTSLIEETEEQLTKSLGIEPSPLEAQKNVLEGRLEDLNRSIQMNELSDQSSKIKEIVSNVEDEGLSSSALKGMGQ